MADRTNIKEHLRREFNFNLNINLHMYYYTCTCNNYYFVIKNYHCSIYNIKLTYIIKYAPLFIIQRQCSQQYEIID